VPSTPRPTGESDSSAPTPPLPVAEYVRMSTDHQRYSTANQAAAIRAYATSHGMRIVKTFMDEGKSGLDMEGRDGLRDLLRVVQSGSADFQAVLVYDVSRWGRLASRPISPAAAERRFKPCWRRPTNAGFAEKSSVLSVAYLKSELSATVWFAPIPWGQDVPRRKSSPYPKCGNSSNRRLKSTA